MTGDHALLVEETLTWSMAGDHALPVEETCFAWQVTHSLATEDGSHGSLLGDPGR